MAHTELLTIGKLRKPSTVEAKGRSYLADVSISIDNEIRVKCEECGGEAQIAIPFRADFFIPRYKV